MKYGIIMIMTILILCGCSDHKKIAYYDNGKIKQEVPMVDGKQNGTMYQYYETGDLKSESHWKKGLINGVAKFYYPNNQLKSKQTWVNGEEEGETIIYYKSGKIKFQGQYSDDHLVGESTFYYENGTIMEKQVHDSTGRLLDFMKYDKKGKLRIEKSTPLYWLPRDTVNLGEPINIEFRLGNKVSRDVNVVIGTYLPTRTNLGLQDTIAMLKPDKDLAFHYTFTPKETGLGEFTGKMSQSFMKDSSKVTQEFLFTIKYYVNKKE